MKRCFLRRKRLADKKYEFTEEDSESSPPLPKLRNSASSIGDLPSGDQVNVFNFISFCSSMTKFTFETDGSAEFV